MRWLYVSVGLLLGCAAVSHAASAKVLKVLPHFLDLKGRHALSPSLFDRDAYQAQLRAEPAKRSGLRFDVNWKAQGYEDLVLRVEAKGWASRSPKLVTLEQKVQPGLFSHWSSATISGDEYKQFGEVIAWRATLWHGTNQVAEQKSFLW
jgi:hypothetical protein